MQCYWHRQRKDGLFLLNAFPCSLSSSPTTTQMSRILAGRNADGYYERIDLGSGEGLQSLHVTVDYDSCACCRNVAEMLTSPSPMSRCSGPWLLPALSKVISLFHLFLIILTSSPLHLDFFSFCFSFTFIKPCFLAHWESDKFGRICVSGHYIFTVSGLVLSNR